MAEVMAAEANAQPEGSAQQEAVRLLLTSEYTPLRSLYIMVFLEVGGFAMCIPVISFFAIKELGCSPTQLGIILSANSLTQLIGASICGRLSDSWGRKWLLLGSFLWSGLGIGTTAIVYNFWELLILRTLQGLSGGTTPLAQSYILDWCSEERRPAFIGLFGFTIGIAFLCGNVCGILMLAAETSRRTIFLVAAFFCLVATLYGLVTIKESLPKDKRRPVFQTASAGEEGDGKGSDKPTPSDLEIIGVGLCSVWLCRFLHALGNAIFFSTYAFLIDEFFGWRDIHLGVIFAVFGFFYALLQFLVYPFFGKHGKLGSSAAFAVASACGVAAGMLFPTPKIPVHCFALFLITITGALFEPAVPVLVGYFAGTRALGFGNGIATACRCAAAVLGPLLGGILFEMGIGIMFYVGAVIYGICFIFSGAVAASPVCAEENDEGTSGRETDPLLSNGKQKGAPAKV